MYSELRVRHDWASGDDDDDDDEKADRPLTSGTFAAGMR